MHIKSMAVVLIVIALAVLGFLFKGDQDQNALAEAASTKLAASNNRINQLNQQNEALEKQIAENAASQAAPTVWQTSWMTATRRASRRFPRDPTKRATAGPRLAPMMIGR